jgi:hypothetical protein
MKRQRVVGNYPLRFFWGGGAIIRENKNLFKMLRVLFGNKGKPLFFEAPLVAGQSPRYLSLIPSFFLSRALRRSADVSTRALRALGRHDEAAVAACVWAILIISAKPVPLRLLISYSTMETVKISARGQITLRAIQQKMKGKGESMGFNTPDDVAAYIRNRRKQTGSGK